MGLGRHTRDKRKVRCIPFLFVALPLASQPSETLTAESRLVMVNASVYDNQNHFHADMTAENFRVLDDGSEVALASVGVEEVPLSAVILLDASRSMHSSYDAALDGLHRFLDKAQAGDEFCLLAFQDHEPADCRFERDPMKVRAQAAHIRPHGGTALGDALLAGLAMAKRSRNARRVVLVLSDGLDNSSSHKWAEVRRIAVESTAAVYALNLPVWGDMDSWQTLRLRRLAEDTGGRLLAARNVKEFPALLEHLEVRQQYVLTFVPPGATGHRTKHQVTVRLRGRAAEHLRVYWRHSYSTVVH